MSAADPRRWGLRLLTLGTMAMIVAPLLTPPWASIGLIVAVVGVLQAGFPIRKAMSLPWLWCGAAFSLWIIIATAIAWQQGLEGSRLRPPGPAWTWLVAPLVALGFAGLRARARILPMVTIILVCSVALATVQFVVGLGNGPLQINPTGTRFSKARGFAELQLTFGLACAVLLVLSLQPLRQPGLLGWRRWLGGLAGLGLLLCGSRSALLGAAAGVWTSLTTRGARVSLVAMILVAAGLGVVGLRFAIAQPELAEATLQMKDGRWPIWRTAVQLASERPLTGWGGQNAFKAAFRDTFAQVNPGQKPEFINGAPHAHSSLLALAAEFGLPAVGLHIAFWLIALGWLWRQRRRAPAAWGLGVGVAMVALTGGLFEAYATRVLQAVAIYGGLGLALALALDPDSTESTQSASDPALPQKPPTGTVA